MGKNPSNPGELRDLCVHIGGYIHIFIIAKLYCKAGSSPVCLILNVELNKNEKTSFEHTLFIMKHTISFMQNTLNFTIFVFLWNKLVINIEKIYYLLGLQKNC